MSVPSRAEEAITADGVLSSSSSPSPSVHAAAVAVAWAAAAAMAVDTLFFFESNHEECARRLSGVIVPGLPVERVLVEVRRLQWETANVRGDVPCTRQPPDLALCTNAVCARMCGP